MFEGQYLTYEEYQELEGTLDETSFNLLEFASRKEIDRNTQYRLKGIDSVDIPSEVKLCIYNMISCINKYNEATEKAGGNIESENIDGYSVKYVTISQVNEIIKNKEVELQDIISSQLFGVIVNDEHLPYLGVK